jgi:hypothetical protein
MDDHRGVWAATRHGTVMQDAPGSQRNGAFLQYPEWA